MNQNIIDQYQIEFKNKISKIDGKITKIPTLKYAPLSTFLFSWTIGEINEFLLPDIDEALLNINSEIENGSETISILLYHNRVDFYYDSGLIYQLPTIDFKEIVIGWRDFLLTPPLNGSKV